MKERRLTDIEVRKLDNEEGMILEGKAVAFDSPATYYGETEVIDPHAFDKCDMKDVVLRYNHNETNYVLARTRNKSLELDVREDGVYFKAHLVETTTNKDAYIMVQSGLVDKCSFAFADYDYDYDEKTRTTRIMDIRKMFDVSIVDFPYYEDTMVVARSLSLLDNGEDTIKKQATERRRKAMAKSIARKLLLERIKNN